MIWKLKVIVTSAVLILAGAMLLGVGSVHAVIRPPQQQGDAEFMEWYNLHKNDPEASYTLTSDLVLTNEEEKKYLLDGNGNITIDCNGYGIVARNPLVIANKGLTIIGHGYFTLRANTDITLQAGKIVNTGGGIALFIAGGALTAPGTDGEVFHIESSGENATGIYHGGNEDVYLKDINMKIEGTGAAKGIYSRMPLNISLEHVTIDVKGNEESSGISVAGNGKVALSKSSVRVNYGQDAGKGASIVAQRIECVDSYLYPDVVTGETVFEILYCERLEPMIVPYAEAMQGVNYPTEVLVQVKNENTGMISEKRLPVQWEKPMIQQSGSYLVSGQLLADDAGLFYANLGKIVPKISLFALPKEGMFLEGYEFIKATEDNKQKILLSMPFPVGAYDVEIQYSTDQREWKSCYNFYGNKNWYDSNACTENWFFSFAMGRPTMENIFYLRTIIKGGVYEGTSQAWELVANSNSQVPPEIAGDSGGDRGGQTISPEEDRIESNEKETKTEQSVPTSNGSRESQGGKGIIKSDKQAEASEQTNTETVSERTYDQKDTQSIMEETNIQSEHEKEKVTPSEESPTATKIYTPNHAWGIWVLLGVLVLGSVVLGVATYKKQS